MKCYPSRLTLLLIVFLMLTLRPLRAQFLDWDFEDIHTDVRQSGARPDLVRDGLDWFHTVYWHQERNQLVYGFQAPGTAWQWLDVPDSGTFGYEARLIVDDNQTAHIAYLHNDGGESTLRYAAYENGLWTIEEVLPGVAIGPYGPDLNFPTYIQPSLDIFLQDNGRPAIMFFNGDFGSIVTCSQVISIYTGYELNLNVALQVNDDQWLNTPQADVPYTGNLVCINGSDRFGEFCQVLEQSDGDRFALAVNLHNHELMYYRASPGDPSNWTYTILDSTSRTLAEEDIYFRESYHFPAASMQSDTVMHLAYGIAHHYGQANNWFNRSLFFYARFHPDSIGQPAYSPFFYEFPFPNEYRAFFQIAAATDDQVFISYYHPETSSMVVLETTNGGQNWTPDTLRQINLTARLQMQVRGDSLHVFAFDEDRNQLLQSSRPLNQPTWVDRYITQNESSGEFLSSVVRRENGQDQFWVAYTETGADQLQFAQKSSGNWTFETIDANERNVSDVSMQLNAAGEPVVAYVFRDLERLKIAYKEGGVWQFQTPESSSSARDVQLGLTPDSLHLMYYDISIGALKHTHGAYPAGPWQTDILDASSSIVGQRPSFVIDEQDQLHVAYMDVLNAKLRYAFRNTSGIWTLEDLTEAQNYTPANVSLAIGQDGNPRAAFRNAGANDIQYAERTGGSWQVNPVDGDVANIVGQPLRLILDSLDRPWILYNYAAVLDELRLVRRTNGGSWAQVSVLNPKEIANVFDFSLVEEDLYVIGRKNVVGATGIGLLYAEQGIKTQISAQLKPTALQMFPNPGREVVAIQVDPGLQPSRLEVYNLQGQSVHFWEIEPAVETMFSWSTADLPPGVYLFRLQSREGMLTRRWVKLP